MRTIYHLEDKSTGENRYYGSITAIFLDERNKLGISKRTLDRHIFSINPVWERGSFLIRKSTLHTAESFRCLKSN